MARREGRYDVRAMPFLEELRAELSREGLNHVGVVRSARYDEVAPPDLRAERIHRGTKAIVVVGSGGRAHWERFLAYVAEDPIERFATRRDPLDDFCAAVFARLGGLLAGCRVLHPTIGATIHVDFMKLGALAGLGHPSELGILVSAAFGPWFGLRAAIFAPHDLDETARGAAPCEGCPAPCRAACPVAAVGPSFSWPLCWTERVRPGSGCRARCDARAACVVAPEAAYDEVETTYHNDRAAGRRLLCARFGVEDRISLDVAW